MTEIELKCATGSVRVKIGDQFEDRGIEWEIAGFGPGETRSEHLLGEAIPNILCRIVRGDMPTYLAPHAEDGTSIYFCGDSIAAGLLSKADGKPRDARGVALRDS